MALVLADRVRETTTTNGTGAVTLLGAVSGYQSFSVVGNSNTTYYCIASQSAAEWEVGIGTYTSSGTTLSRDTILASSNSGSIVPFTSGTKDVFVTYPAGKSVNYNAAGNVALTGGLTLGSALPVASGGTGQTSYTDGQLLIGNSSGNTLTKATLTQGSGVTITNGNGTITIAATGLGGDVVGPASSTDNAVVRFDGTTGKLVQNSGVLIADDGTTVIDVSSATAALRVTQTGAGNALVVEDSANPDSTPFVIDASGRVLMGATSTTGLAGSQIWGVDSFVQQQFRRYSDDTTSGSINFFKGRGNATTSAIVQNGDALGVIGFSGQDGSSTAPTATIVAARIEAAVDGTPGTSDMPGRLVFSTTADGASTPTERMRIDSAGAVGVGGTPDYAGKAQKFYVTDGTYATAWVEGTSTTALIASQVSSNTTPAALQFRKSRGTIGTPTIVSDGDFTGQIQFYGYDGAAIKANAWISAQVDGTPGTNDMPGRLVFSTTASGSSSPTERMRITNAGKVGIGVNPAGNTSSLVVGGTTTYGAIVSHVLSVPTFGAGVNTRADAYLSYPSVNNASGTLGTLNHFYASQNTFSTAVTAQVGFQADSSLTGATNNYGFYSNIASGTGRWNFFANGTADNYFAGSVGIGAAPNAAVKIDIGGTYPSSGTESYGLYARGSAPSASTSNVYGVVSQQSTDNAAFAPVNIRHFTAFQGTITGGSRLTTTNQIGFLVDSGLTGATNNYGFYSAIASGTGRWNFYAAGTANNYFAGAVGVGTTALTGYSLFVGRNTTGATDAYGISVESTVQSDVTNSAYLYFTYGRTAAASFTLSNLTHYGAGQGGIGVGSTVTNQYGFYALGSLTGATNNYGFYSNIASGTGRWNFYASGTADNYFAGSVGIGTASLTGYNLRVGANSTGSTTAVGILKGGTVQSDVTSSYFAFRSELYTQAAAFTLASATHYYADQQTIGATSAVTTQYGFRVASNLTGATNNYGFYSDIASGTGRWNFFAADTANNAYKGSSSFGTITAPTALVMIAAGTATANTAPLKFTSGTNLTTPEAGVVEYDGTTLSATTNTNFKRGTVEVTNYASGVGTSLTATAEATLQVLLPSANDTITLSVGTYFLDLCCTFTRGTTSTTSATARINILGTGNAVGSFSGMAISSATAASASSNFSFDAVNINTSNVVTAASTTASGVYTITLRGILKITTQGTIIPQYNLSSNLTSAGTATAPKVLYLNLTQLDTQSAAAFGPAGTGWA